MALLEMQKLGAKLLVFGGVILVISAAATLYNSYRNGVMSRLYAEAAGYPPFFRGSSESTAAVRRIASYRGQRSTRMLLDIGLARGPMIWPDTQTEAIQLLRERNDPDTAIALANLLQPHERLGTRQAVATALKELPCKIECVRSVLHYLERTSRGEPNEEDLTLFPPGTENLRVDEKKDQQVLYDTLYAVLQREKLATLTNLDAIYGLGSDDSSPFGLELVSRIQLHEACPYLLRSDKLAKSSPPGLHSVPPKQLQAAIASLNCQ
jgi:hypothetical protein